MDMKGIQETDISREISEQAVTKLVNCGIICRVCAKESDKLIAIFGEDGTSNELAMKMNLYLPIKVLETDEMPLQCCWPCASTILAWHDLVLSCVDADRRLRSYNFIVSEKQLPEPTFTDERVLSSGVVDMVVTSGNENQNAFNGSHLSHEALVDSNVIESFNLALQSNNAKSIVDCSQALTLDTSQNNYDIVEERDALGELLSPNSSVSFKDESHQGTNCDEKGAISDDSEDESMYRYACSFCSNLFISECDIRIHLKEYHPDADTTDISFDVSEVPRSLERTCGSSPAIPILKQRNRKNNKIDQEVVNAAKMVVEGKIYYNCKECGKSLHSPYTYVWHMRIHTGERPYVCDLCGKQFRVSQGLVRHLKETHARIKNFACDICNRYFATRRNVEEHRRIHTNERPYVCDLCGKSFKQKASLFVHNRSHTNHFPFKCNHCPQAFRTKPLLMLHVTRHTGEKPYPCDICGRRFRIKYELKRHKLIHSDEKPFTCNMCALGFRQKRIKDESIESEAETWKKNLIKDELNIVDVKSIGESDNSNLNDCVLLVTYSDPDSSLDREITLSNNDSDRDSAKGLATGARARKGIKTRRRQERKRNTLGKPYCSNLQEYLKYINFEKKSCNICHTSYNTYISLKKHLKDTHDLKEPRRRRRKEEIESLFQCFHCDKSYNRKYDMEKHVKKKHPDVKLESKQKVKKDVEHCKIETPDGVVYKCESCDQCFKCSYTLTRHQTIHTDARTHFCHICGKNFRVSSALSRHINEHHHGIKRFNCSICNKMFRTKAGRDEHLNIHNDLRPFVCDTCGKSFKQRASLHVHKMFHTNNFRFSCDVCDKKFLRKNDLKQHGLIHTGEKPFKCSVCDLAFRLKYDLKRHMGVHLKAACNKCGVEFNQERHMKKHRKDCRPEAEINVPTSS